MIHYHGTPFTPKSERAKMAGKHFCVSFAHPDDANWCMENGQSVMWDNGAFSFRSKGGLDPIAFSIWVDPRLAHPHWAVIPDVIDGDVDEQKQLINQWNHSKELSAPVWHMGLDIDWLLHLSESFPRICFGSTQKFWQVGSELWERRADEAFNALERRGLRPWVHMLRGLSLCGERWPFASADSTNVALNFKGSRSRHLSPVCPERMARVIDARQSPVKWRLRAEQSDLFGE